MKIEIKNATCKPLNTKLLFDYFQSIDNNNKWEYNGFIVELDSTFDFKGDDVLIRWTDINEGFNDKVIVNSLEEFHSSFRLLYA